MYSLTPSYYKYYLTPITHRICFSMMTDNEFQADSPIRYTVEEGEIGFGAASPATIVETHTMDTVVQTTSQPQSTESSRPQSPE